MEINTDQSCECREIVVKGSRHSINRDRAILNRDNDNRSIKETFKLLQDFSS